ncbi:MAG: DUF4405 domain-containing protein [Alphaproteobacteria bacterium]|nr:DUF4405 domain-containing protein [Alphaproteobacteria bacterium]
MTSKAKPRTSRTADGRERIYRHALLVRVTHWINVVCIVVLLLSGLQIFNAHARLYWGSDGAWSDPAALSISAVTRDGEAVGITQIGPAKLETTGVLGVSARDGEPERRAWPAWATLPSFKSLALGRAWHFFFAWLFVLNGLVYLAHLIATGRLRRDMLPTMAQWRNIGPSFVSHLKLHRIRGEDSKTYNVLQKIAYLAIIFLFLPLMLLTGLTMSPGMNAAAPWLLDVFGGRQSARTLHFISAFAIIGFVAIHVFEVFLQGPVNEIRSMITGWFTVEPEKKKETRDDAKA